MRIRWTPAAAADLDQIKDYLAERHPDLTQPTVVKLEILHIHHGARDRS